LSESLINIEALSKLINKSVDEIRELIKKGLPNSRGQFDGIKVIHWLINYLENEIKESKLISRKEVAELLGYKNDKYINELELSNGLPKEDFNKYNIYKVVKWFIDYKEKLHRNEIERIKNVKPQDHLASKSAEFKELLIEEKKRNLLRKDEVAQKWIEEIQIINNALTGFPIKVANKIVGITDEQKIIEIVSEELNKVKENISKTKLEF